MKGLRCTVFLAVLFLGVASITTAQPGRVDTLRSGRGGGFWAAAGAGYVALGAGCESCGQPTYHPGLAVYLRAGGTLKPGIGLGVQVASLTRGGDTTSVRMLVATLMAQWHPWLSRGFYVLMGYGVAGGRQDYRLGGTPTRTSHAGLGLNFEVGWDIRVGRINITPNVSSIVGALGDLQVRAQDGSQFLLKDAMGTGYQFGLAIGFP